MRFLIFSILVMGVVFASCKEDDRCENLTCFNGGTCVDGVCDCPPGYTGFNCQDFDPCDTLECLNGGTCVFGVCSCPDGFFGDSCQFFDPCFDVVCENGGTCVDGICECAPNYEGENCENQIQPTSIEVMGIQVSLFPLNQPNGQPWDATSLPDILPQIAKDGTVLYTAPGAFVNAAQGGSYNYPLSVPLVITDVLGIHEFTLLDGDMNDETEVMGTVFFTPYNAQNDFPDELEYSSDSITFSLSVEYNW